MKKRIFIPFQVLLFSFLSISLIGQVVATQGLMSLGNQDAMSMDIENVNQKSLETYFKSYFKEYGKIKFNRKAKEFFIVEAKMNQVSKNKLDVYAKIEDLNNSTRFYLWIDNGNGFINSSDFTEEYDNAEELLMDFSIYIKKSLIEDELKAGEKALSKAEKDYKQLQKDNDKYHKTIEEALKKIAEMEENIEKNIIDQENKVAEIEIYKNGVEEVKERLKNVGNSKM